MLYDEIGDSCRWTWCLIRDKRVLSRVVARCPMALLAVGVASFWTDKSKAQTCCAAECCVWNHGGLCAFSLSIFSCPLPLPPLPTAAIDFIFLSFNGVNKFFKVFTRPERASDRCISKWRGAFLKHRARQETGEDKAYIRVERLQPRWRERMKNFT